MKILFITDLYPIKTGKTTTPLTLHNFVFEWIKQGNIVDVIKPNFLLNNFVRGKSFYKTGFYEYEGVKIFNVNYFTPFCFNFIKKIEKQMNPADYDVIIAHMPAGIIFANKLAKIFNKKLICGVHCSDIEVLTNPIYSIYFKNELVNAYKNSQKIACRSFVLQQKFSQILQAYADKTFVAASGIKQDEIQTGQKEDLSSFCPVCKLITCANLIKRKNIGKLITATNDLEGFELTVIGDGKELKKLINSNKSHKIKFKGRLSHKKVLEEMQKADIFILPSINETFGLVYLEAMACGCLTVCTKNDGIDGIIQDEINGFLTEPSIEGIKETLLRIKNNKNLKGILQNSIETIKKYSQEACAKNYLDNLNI